MDLGDVSGGQCIVLTLRQPCASRLAMSKLTVSTRVRLKGHQRVFVVVEVDPPGCEPLAPSTYTVRLALPPDQKPDYWLYGDAVLELADG